ncbi:hypothetical protein LZ30DRAFT_781043 [Colletotrichum cereale]|nr:hypothetical protein LZ30DRAFT_781043 [Colletotrichum cereale]
MIQKLDTEVSPQAADLRKMMKNNETLGALLTKAVERLDAATDALMSEKTEFALAKKQILMERIEFASVNRELEKAMAVVEDIVTIQSNNLVDSGNGMNSLTPTSSVCSDMGTYDGEEHAFDGMMELQHSKKELGTVKHVPHNTVADGNTLDNKSEQGQNGFKGDRQDDLEHKAHELDSKNTAGIIQDLAKERDDLKTSIIEEVKQELKELKEQLETEMKAKLKTKLKTKVTNLKTDLMADLMTELKAEVIEHVNANIKHEFIKHEIKDAVSHEITECTKPRFLDEIYEDMRNVLRSMETKGEKLQSSFDDRFNTLEENLYDDISSIHEANKKIKKMVDRIDEKLAPKPVQSWGETRDKMHKAKNRQQPHVVALAPPEMPLKDSWGIPTKDGWGIATNASSWGDCKSPSPETPLKNSEGGDNWHYESPSPEPAQWEPMPGRWL